MSTPWQTNLFFNCHLHVQLHHHCCVCASSDDWRGGLPAADPDRHCEDHEHQARTRPQDLQRHSHVQEHRRGTQVIPPLLTRDAGPPFIMCQIHSVAGKRPWPLFHVFGVLYPSERGRGEGGGLIRVKGELKERFEDAGKLWNADIFWSYVGMS